MSTWTATAFATTSPIVPSPERHDAEASSPAHAGAANSRTHFVAVLVSERRRIEAKQEVIRQRMAKCLQSVTRRRNLSAVMGSTRSARTVGASVPSTVISTDSAIALASVRRLRV